MGKIKIFTDSASDIDMKTAEKYNIDVKGFNILIDEKTYIEGKDISAVEFYEKLKNSSDFPKTSQLTFLQFVDFYADYYNQGYTDVIYVSITSTGSATYNNACVASERFYEEYPDAKGKFNIHVIDSKAYSGCYGYPVIKAASKIQKGADISDVLAFINDWLSSVEVFFIPYTLEYIKKSGRLSSAAAFVGELLGLKPVISIIDGISENAEKVRGEKAVIPKLISIAKNRMIPKTPYVLLRGSLDEETQNFEKELIREMGYPPEYICYVGATISCHVGSKLLGIIYKGEKRR